MQRVPSGRRRAAVQRLGPGVERLGGVGARRGGAVRAGVPVVVREGGLVLVQVARGGGARVRPARAPRPPLVHQRARHAAAEAPHPAHPVAVPPRQHERRA